MRTNGRILFVEDDEASQYIYLTALERAGFTVDLATDARRAEQLVGVRRPDLVVMDLGRPRGEGWELTRRLKSYPGMEDVPVLVVTVYGFPEDEAQSVAAGGTQFMVKPVRPLQLVRAVEDLLP